MSWDTGSFLGLLPASHTSGARHDAHCIGQVEDLVLVQRHSGQRLLGRPTKMSAMGPFDPPTKWLASPRGHG